MIDNINKISFFRVGIIWLTFMMSFFVTYAQVDEHARWFPKLASHEYVNPVIPGFFPDPSVVKVGDTYYCVNSTFEYFPGIIISQSKDLINWQQIGHVFTKSEDLDLTHFFDAMGIWAPDISYHNGEFYIFYCKVQLSKDRSTNVRGNYMVKSSNILGPWTKPVQLTDNGNDPSHFVSPQGEHYMLYAAGIPQGNGTKIVKLNADCTKIIEGPFWLETEGKKAAPEGPHLLFKDGYYYLTMAASGGLFNGHHMLVARSKNIYGPYENSPYNPSLTQKNPQAINFHQGHGKIFSTQNNEWYTMVLSQRWLPGTIRGEVAKKGISPLGRETSLIPLNWTANGWPVETPTRQALDIAHKPNLPFTPVKNLASDEFNHHALGIQWQFRRNPIAHDYSLKEKKGHLRIYTSNFDIDTIKGRNLILQRERWLKYTASTKISFKPETAEEAGLVCHYDTKTYLRLGVRANKGKLKLLLEECNNGKKRAVAEVLDIKRKTLYLKVSVDMLKRSFFYSYDGQKWLAAGVVENASYLSDQGTPNWGFMGTMVGLYAFNKGTGKRIPADFDFFRVQSFHN